MMATLAQALNRAVERHQAGDLETAARIYREILEHDARQADAWHLLGLVYYAQGRHAEAAEVISRAIRLDGGQASFHNHLAEALLALERCHEAEASCRRALVLDADYAVGHNTLGTILAAIARSDEAIASYRRAIELSPSLAQAHFNLGGELLAQGDQREAEASFRRALTAVPDYPRAWHALAMLLERQMRYAEAADAYRRVIELEPEHAEAYCNLGGTLKELHRPQEAIASCQRALELAPELAEAHFTIGLIHQAREQWEPAEAAYRRTLEIEPEHVGACNNLGTLCRQQGRLAEAIGCYERVLELQPDSADALCNLGNAFSMQGRRAEARVCYERTLQIVPEHAEARTFRAMALLAEGNFAEGWREYEWRWKCADFPPQRHAAIPLWDGSALEGRSLLVHAEQGFGDTLQFARYVPLIDAASGRVVCEVQPPLVSLLRQSGFPAVFAAGEALPRCDVRVPLLSLPRVFGTTLDTIPHDVPYLSVDAGRAAEWRRLLAGDNFKVAIVWQGRPTYRSDRFRSIHLSHFEPLARVPGVQLVALQTGRGQEQVAEVAADWPLVDVSDPLHDFHDTAAALANVELVIACDTAVAHLAGALGVPAWVALPRAADWRWLQERLDSPWYPTLRLFRQTAIGDWSDVFARMAAELRQRAAKR